MNRRILSILAGLFVLLMACNFPGLVASQPTATPLPPTAVQPAPAATEPPQPEATQEPPTAEPTEPPAVEPNQTPAAITGPLIRYGNVRFTLPPELSTQVTASVVAGSEPGEDQPFWGINPDYISIELAGYPLAGTFHKPRIEVYPVAQFQEMNEGAANIIADLQTVLAEQPAERQSFPFLPLFNAGQVFHAQVAYLDFVNGSGVRYLTQYSQFFAAINNNELFYTYQGLTADNAYYVSAILPISSSILPANFDDAANTPEGGVPYPTDYDADDYDTRFQQYLADMTARLNEVGPADWSPQTTTLDSFVMSIQIE